jgi:hypothetical protein
MALKVSSWKNMRFIPKTDTNKTVIQKKPGIMDTICSSEIFNENAKVTIIIIPKESMEKNASFVRKFILNS